MGGAADALRLSEGSRRKTSSSVALGISDPGEVRGSGSGGHASPHSLLADLSPRASAGVNQRTAGTVHHQNDSGSTTTFTNGGKA